MAPGYYYGNYSLFLGIEITTLTIAIVCFSLRLGNRYIKRSILLDDVVLIVAFMFAIIITSMVFRLYSLGYGINDGFPDATATPIGKLSLTLFSIFPLSYSLIRISIVLTYLKLFPSQTNRWVCWALCGAQIAYSIWAALATALQCRPIQGYWNKQIDFDCKSPKIQDFVILALNSVFDMITYIWPAQYLFNLKMPMKTRLELIAAFGIGLLNLGLSFARLSMLITMYRTEKWMQYGIWGMMIIVLESHVGVICACLPYLRFLFDYVFTNYLSQISSRHRATERSKSKHTNANFDALPLQKLGDGGSASNKIHRKIDIDVSTYRDEGSEENLTLTPDNVEGYTDAHTARSGKSVIVNKHGWEDITRE